MLKLGFAEDVDAILSFVLSKRGKHASTDAEFRDLNFDVDADTTSKLSINMDEQQLLLFSATQPPWVQRVSGKFLKDPLIVDAMHKRALR